MTVPKYRFREFAPKPLDPGQPFNALGLTGVVWSAGPEASSLWVLCDGGEVRAVKLSKGVPSRILTHHDDWREKVHRIAAGPYLPQEYRRVS